MKNKLLLSIWLFTFLLISQLTFAQVGLMYYMRNVPHSYELNPAIRPNYKFMLGAPLLSGFEFSMGNNALSFNDVIQYNETIKGPVLPLFSAATKEDFLHNFRNKNNITVSNSINLGTLGFRIKDLDIVFSGNLVSSFRTSYPNDLINFALNGNPKGIVMDLSVLYIDLTNYRETGVTISKKITDKLQVGIRPKILNGLFTFYTTKNHNSAHANVESIIVDTEFETRAAIPSIPGIDISTDSNGLIQLDSDLSQLELTTSSYTKSSYSNPGLGIDLGAHYTIIPKLELSASITNLGFIHWGGLTYRNKIKGSFYFDGLDITNTDPNSLINYADSTLSNFSIEGNANSFFKGLNPKLFIGGHYYLAPTFDVGLLSKTSFYYKDIDEAVTLFANWNPLKGLSLSTGYELSASNGNSLSFGIGYKLLIFNGYFTTETIPLQYDKVYVDEYSSRFNHILIPVNYKTLNFRFGVNIVIGNIE